MMLNHVTRLSTSEILLLRWISCARRANVATDDTFPCCRGSSDMSESIPTTRYRKMSLVIRARVIGSNCYKDLGLVDHPTTLENYNPERQENTFLIT
jgi:hypothetical protein